MNNQWVFIDNTDLDANIRKQEATIRVRQKYDDIMIFIGKPNKSSLRVIDNVNIHTLPNNMFRYTNRIFIGDILESVDNIIATGFSVRGFDESIVLHIDSGHCRVLVFAR